MSLEEVVECGRVVQIIIVQTGQDVWLRIPGLLDGVDQQLVNDESLPVEGMPFLFGFTKSSRSIRILIVVVEELNLNLLVALLHLVPLLLLVCLFRHLWTAAIGLCPLDFLVFSHHLLLEKPPLRELLFLLLIACHGNRGDMLEIPHRVCFVEVCGVHRVGPGVKLVQLTVQLLLVETGGDRCVVVQGTHSTASVLRAACVALIFFLVIDPIV